MPFEVSKIILKEEEIKVNYGIVIFWTNVDDNNIIILLVIA